MRSILIALALAAFSLGTARAQTQHVTTDDPPPLGLWPATQLHLGADSRLADHPAHTAALTRARRSRLPRSIASDRIENGPLRTEWSVQRWTDGDWANENRNLYTYDEADRLTQQVTLDWTEDRWENYSRQFYTYIDDAVSEKLTQRWFNAAWEDDYSEQFTYDSDGHLIEVLFRRQTGSGLGDYARTLYTHSDEKTVTLDQLSMGTEGWQDLYRSFSTYHGGNLVEFVFQSRSADAWHNHSRQLYAYERSDLIEVIHQNWFEGAWRNGRREVRTYDHSGTPSGDGEGRVTEYLHQTWEAGAWQNSDLTSYLYDLAGRLDESLHQRWGAEGWYDNRREVNTHSGRALVETLLQDRAYDGWENAYRHIYAYAAATASEASASPSRLVLSAFPNPTSGHLYLSILLSSPSEVTVEVLGMLGRRVAVLPAQRYDTGEHTLDWDLSALPAGAYVLRLTGAATATRRFTVVR